MVERYERAQQQEEEGYRRRQQQGVGFCATGLLELALTKTQPDPGEDLALGYAALQVKDGGLAVNGGDSAGGNVIQMCHQVTYVFRDSQALEGGVGRTRLDSFECLFQV